MKWGKNFLSEKMWGACLNLVFSAYSALSKARALSIGEDPLLCYGGYNSLCPILRPQCCKFSVYHL